MPTKRKKLFYLLHQIVILFGVVMENVWLMEMELEISAIAIKAQRICLIPLAYLVLNHVSCLSFPLLILLG